MTIPVQIGLPQIVLLAVGLLGVALLVTSVVGLRAPTAPREEPTSTTSDTSTAPTGRLAVVRRRVARLTRSALPLRRVRLRRPRFRRGGSGVALLLVAISLLWFTALAQSYLGLTGEIHAAHVTATRIENAPHTLSVELTLYDDDGRTESRRVYQVEGDRWVLQANILEFKHWVNILGVHSGYKVTRLYGQYSDGTPPTQHHIFLNGGDDDFFQSMQNHSWWTAPVIRAAYGNAVIAAPGEYEVYISQDAIKARAAGD